jgi:hypothetical protein
MRPEAARAAGSLRTVAVEAALSKLEWELSLQIWSLLDLQSSSRSWLICIDPHSLENLACLLQHPLAPLPVSSFQFVPGP